MPKKAKAAAPSKGKAAAPSKGKAAAPSKEKFDLNKLHSKAMIEHSKMVDRKKRDVSYHLQENFEIDKKASYDASIEACGDDETRIAHLESLLKDGVNRLG